jgi:hypothetical protein
MIEPTRGTRFRRGNRRPGWVLLTALLVLAIVASSALVFTNKVELLRLAVIVALWAAVVAAFISFIYRRQADIDQAKARDLKLVYDLQLDREISARREYELSVESQLRRELTAELRAQNADEVASLRAELAALRANLEIIFDTDLQHRPAIENERTAVHSFGRVISSRIDTEDRQDVEDNTEESPIIDVPEEPHPPEYDWTSPPMAGGAHRRASEREFADSGWRAAAEPSQQQSRAAQPTPEPETRRPWQPIEHPAAAQEPRPMPAPEARPMPAPEPRPMPAPEPRPQPAAAPEPTPTPPPLTAQPPAPEPTPAPAPPPPPGPPVPPPSPTPWREPEREGRHAPAASGWQPAPADGRFIPAGEPGSNWESAVVDNGTAAAPVADEQQPPPPTSPAMTPPPAEPRRGRHGASEATGEEPARRARHWSPEAEDPGRRSPTLATPPAQPTPPPASPEPPFVPPAAPEAPSPRHRGAEEVQEEAGQHAGGQPVSELLARLQAGSAGGGRRRRREE